MAESMSKEIRHKYDTNATYHFKLIHVVLNDKKLQNFLCFCVINTSCKCINDKRFELLLIELVNLKRLVGNIHLILEINLFSLLFDCHSDAN